MTQQLNPESQELMIELKDMNKWYGEFHVLKNINLEVKKGEKIVICGPSGSGKSTMIRCINRLEEHQKGHIFVSGNELTADLKNIEAVRRDVGMCCRAKGAGRAASYNRREKSSIVLPPRRAAHAG